MAEVIEQTAEQRVVELEEMIFQMIGHPYDPSLITSARELIGLGPIKEDGPAIKSQINSKPKVLIMESSYNGLDWWVDGDVEVDSISDYAVTEASDSELCNDYEEDYYRSLASDYHPGSPPYKALMELQTQFDERRAEVKK
jgi:hypothetical protein